MALTERLGDPEGGGSKLFASHCDQFRRVEYWNFVHCTLRHLKWHGQTTQVRTSLFAS